jgi:hypothetical protein
MTSFQFSPPSIWKTVTSDQPKLSKLALPTSPVAGSFMAPDGDDGDDDGDGDGDEDDEK